MVLIQRKSKAVKCENVFASSCKYRFFWAKSWIKVKDINNACHVLRAESGIAPNRGAGLSPAPSVFAMSTTGAAAVAAATSVECTF